MHLDWDLVDRKHIGLLLEEADLDSELPPFARLTRKRQEGHEAAAAWIRSMKKGLMRLTKKAVASFRKLFLS